MGKPLLTDEMIARANRGAKSYDKGHFDSEETIVISTDNQIPQSSYDKTRDLNENYDDYDYEDYDEEPIIKSRRIENAKRGKFQSKLNWILIGVVLLLAFLAYAIFKL